MTGTTETWRQVAEDARGWLHPAEGPALARWAAAALDDVPELPIAEIGGYAGKSACWLGAVARDYETVLYSIDWHRGSPEMSPGQACHHPEMIDPDGRFDSLPHFRRTLAEAHLEDWVIPVVGRTQRVVARWRTPLAFLFIDGGHDDDTVMHDCLKWAPLLTYPSGILAFHDVPIPGIARAVETALAGGFELAERVDDLQILRWDRSDSAEDVGEVRQVRTDAGQHLGTTNAPGQGDMVIPTDTTA